MSHGNTYMYVNRAKIPNGDISTGYGVGEEPKGLPRIDRRRFMTGPKTYHPQNNNIRTVSPWRPPPDHSDRVEPVNGDAGKEHRTSLPNITPPPLVGHADGNEDDGT